MRHDYRPARALDLGMYACAWKQHRDTVLLIKDTLNFKYVHVCSQTEDKKPLHYTRHFNEFLASVTFNEEVLTSYSLPKVRGMVITFTLKKLFF